MLNRFLAENGVTADIITMRGAVEVAPRLKLANAICDLVSTGATLEANGLAPLDTVLRSEAVLIRAPKKIDPELEKVAESVVQRFKGVTSCRGAKIRDDERAARRAAEDQRDLAWRRLAHGDPTRGQ